MKTERLDIYLYQKGYAASREKAKRLIDDGAVSVNGRTASKASLKVSDRDTVVTADVEQYVGRGALKLIKAFEQFPINVRGKVCADLGASTGGFTQILLRQGAAKVYAVDVGHGQLAQQLVCDERVVNCEGVNVRYMKRDIFCDIPTFICGDLSFISLKQIIPAAVDCFDDDAEFVFLIKPQFEAGKAAVGKNGIVADRKKHIAVLEDLCGFFPTAGLSLRGLTFSPICGGDGNREYLAYLKKFGEPAVTPDLQDVVKQAFERVK